MKKTFVFYIFLWFFCLHAPPAACEADVEWSVLQTRYTTLYYQSRGDLEKFDGSVRLKMKGTLQGSAVTLGADDLEKRVKKTIDMLFKKAQQILDMRNKIRKIKIRLFAGKKQLAETYEKIFRQPGRARAWYLFEKNTVYLQADDLLPGMVAHELAHAIIDNYLKVRPPRATAEILARYVDGHLFDERYKKYN